MRSRRPGVVPFDLQAQTLGEAHKNKRTKNIIFMVSDGMSFGTLVMTDLYLKRKFGRPSSWIGLYERWKDAKISYKSADCGKIIHFSRERPPPVGAMQICF